MALFLHTPGIRTALGSVRVDGPGFGYRPL